jgi:prepilin signal peptidase PulO-like enzyme (type II secretory pathway)
MTVPFNVWPFSLCLFGTNSVLATGMLLAFALGAVVGSFLNVCLHRLLRGESLLWPASRCGHCLQAVRWYDNIPLLSYWVLWGRCRSCGWEFSARYFWIELSVAAGYAGLFGVEVLLNNPPGALLEGKLEISPEFFVTWGMHTFALSVVLIAACMWRLRRR